MGYGKGHRKGNSRASSAKNVASKAPTASTQKEQILDIGKRLTKVERQEQQTIERAQFYQAFDKNMSTIYTKQNITPKFSWTEVFGANENLAESGTLVVDSMHMEYAVLPNTEEALCDITVTVVTPKSQKVYEETTGMTLFIQNTDYVYYDGLVLWNLKRFKLHHYKRTQTVMQQNVTTDTETGSYTPLIQKNNIGRCKMNLNHKIKNTLGPWGDVAQDELPYYMHTVLVVFNNNSALDVNYPNIKGTILWKTHALK